MIRKFLKKNHKKRLQNLAREVEQAQLERLRTKAKNERIDRLARELNSHLDENNFRQRRLLPIYIK